VGFVQLATMVILTPGVAEAATCGQSWSDKDKSGSGFPDGPGSPSQVTLPSGIYGACSSRGDVYGIRLCYHCYRVNSYGNTWTNVRIDGTNVNGWVYDAYLSNGGSTVPC
jgi:hypothetical protein